MLAAPTVDCRGYGLEMTPWRCIENQLSPMCLPGWPCHECEEAVSVVVKGKSFYCAKLSTRITQGLCAAAYLEAKRRKASWPEGMGWLSACVDCSGGFLAKVGEEASRRHQVRAPKLPGSGTPSLKKTKNKGYDPKTMSRAVARDLGLI